MSDSPPKRVDMVVTFLEMTHKPAALPPPAPKGKVALLKAERPSTHFYRYLYDRVGGPWLWVERKKMNDAQLAAILDHPANDVYVLYVGGCPAGMAELDFRQEGVAQLDYFGLMPEFIGRRLGYFFLYNIVAVAWCRPIGRLKVNTCTLDHPNALPLYQRLGFTPYSREDRYIELP